ncbi:RpiR family transcriptional regulator, partial [Streptomyces sp. SA3_actF]
MEQNSEKSPADLAAHIRSHLSGLSGAEARVAHTLLDLGERLVGLSVSEVAALAETAPSSVVRTCQRLEFRGFQELKIAAARQAPR